MSTLYEETLVRLTKYREMNHLSQEEMGNIMGITQSHYSKVEQGKKMISGTALLNLSKYNVDMDFFLTGQETLVTELDDYLSKCKSEYKRELIMLMVWLVNRGTNMMNKAEEWGSVDYSREVELLRMKEQNGEIRDSIWYGIRKMKHLTQDRMAKLLDINIKKYRDIERENRIPDAEVLVNLYEKTGILPSILLGEEISNLSVMNLIWREFTPEIKKRLLEILDRAYALFEGKD